MINLDKNRAEKAWYIVQKIIGDDPHSKAANDEKDEIKKLPAKIQTAGLGHALAFLAAKGKAPKTRECIDEWILNESSPGGIPVKQDTRQYLTDNNIPLGKQALISIVQDDPVFLRRATDETLALLTWIKRFAESEIKDSEPAPADPHTTA